MSQPPLDPEAVGSREFQERIADDVVIFDLGGRLSDLAGSRALHDAIACHLNDDRRKFLLNLDKVLRLDSAGISSLIAARAQVANADGELKLAHLAPKVREVLTITRILDLLEAYENEESALASFSPSA